MENKEEEIVETEEQTTETPKAKGGKPAKAEKPAKKEKSDDAEVLALLKGISSGMQSLEKRINKIETGGRNEFMENSTPEDVQVATEMRKGIDPRVCEIVDEILGEDFGIRIGSNKDKPGYLFTLVVPPRLSDLGVDKRPIRDPANPTAYVKDAEGNVVMEEYTPEDHRSRHLHSTDSFDVIRQHCERVRGYIVAYFQKVSKPLPEFRVK